MALKLHLVKSGPLQLDESNSNQFISICLRPQNNYDNRQEYISIRFGTGYWKGTGQSLISMELRQQNNYSNRITIIPITFQVADYYANRLDCNSIRFQRHNNYGNRPQ